MFKQLKKWFGKSKTTAGNIHEKAWTWIFDPMVNDVPTTVQKHYEALLHAMEKNDDALVLQKQSIIMRFRWRVPTTLAEMKDIKERIDAHNKK